MLGKKISNSSGGKGRLSHPNYPSTSKNSTPASPDTAPVFPHLKLAENNKLLPKYSFALSRPHDEYLPPEDLDSIQLELETLLSTVALRYRAFKSELECGGDKDDKREKKVKIPERPPTSPGKRKRGADDKKMKIGGSSKVGKLKSLSAQSPASSHQTDDSLDSYYQGHARENPKLILPKNDTPNKFWLSVEPYCMPLTHEDIKLLDDLIEEYSGQLVPAIPDLGPHYSTQWAMEDLKEEQDNSNPNAKLNKRFIQANLNDVAGALKKGEKLIGEGVTGPLTQRLVAALIEENLMPDNGADTSSNNSSDTAATNRAMAMLKNGVDIERRVRKELIEQGILDADDFTKSTDDEILSEIVRVRAELSAIAEYNSTELRKLKSAASEEMKRLEVKRKLDVVDQDIIKMYEKICHIKFQKRRPLTKPERDEVYRLTQEQKRLSDLLETMATPEKVQLSA